MQKNNSIRLKQAIPVLAYLVANVLILFVRGVFWDDWAFYENPEGIRQILTGVGAPWRIGFHLYMLNLSHFLGIDMVLPYRILIFIIGLLNVLLFSAILKYWNLKKEIIFYSTLLYAVWPLGYAHIEMCCFVYQVGLLLQLTSILLFHIYNENKRLYIIPLFACSQFLATMFLNSSIVLWLGYLFVYTYRDINIPDSFKNTISYIFNKTRLYNFLWFIPCIVLFAIKSIFWHPQEIYATEAYNAITVNSLLMLPLNILFSFTNTIKALFTQFTGILSSKLLLLVALLVLSAFWLLFRKGPFDGQKKKITSKTLIIFVLLFLSAIGAYVAIGKIPEFDTMDDRHGIFIPFVLVTFVALLINNVIKGQKWRRMIFVLCVSVSMTYSFSQYIKFIYYSHQNDVIVSMFKNTPMPPGNVIVAETEFNTLSNFYTWAGLYKMGTGHQDKCFMMVNVGKFFDQEEYLVEMHNQKDATPGEPSIGIFINDESKQYAKTLLRECYYRINSTKYRESLQAEFDIRVEFFDKKYND